MKDATALENATEKEKRDEIERIRKTPPCPLCSGHGIKAWHPQGMCPFNGIAQ